MTYELIINWDVEGYAGTDIIEDLDENLLELVKADRKATEVQGGSYSYRVEAY